MRILPNRYEKATLQKEINDCETQVFNSNIAMIFNQPHETLFKWMQEIASNRDDNKAIQNSGVQAKVGIVRPMASHMQQEPSMGRIAVLSIPATGVEDDKLHAMAARLNHRIHWQRFVDFYGPGVGNQVASLAQNPNFYTTDAALISIDDFETDFLIVVREPTSEIMINDQALSDYADKVLTGIFRTIAMIEAKSEKLDPRVLARLPIAPRLMDVTAQQPEGTTEFKARGYGIDVEIALNGCEGNHQLDHIYAAAFWKHFLAYVKGRPDPTTLPGIYDATQQPVGHLITPITDAAAEEAVATETPDNLQQAL
jgi:hypothetical protein